MTAPLPAPADRADPRSLTMFGLLAVLLRHARVLVAGFALGGGIAAAWSLIATEQFTAVTVFAPGEQPLSALPSGLAALGSQFGATFAADNGTRSLPFYAELLKSEDLLKEIATDTFTVADTRAPLTQLLHQGGDSPARAVDNSISFLREHAINVTVNDRTGTITMAVVLDSPDLAAEVANRLYGRLEAFNTQMQQASAAARRRFAERELASARDSLERREGALRAFLEQNRGGLGMPRLALERARLQRRIDVAQIAFGQMTQELTEARIAEARDTPTFTIMQRAEPPLDRSYPARTRMTVLGAILGLLLAAAFVALRATAGNIRALDPAGYRAMQQALGRLRGGARRDASQRK